MRTSLSFALLLALSLCGCFGGLVDHLTGEDQANAIRASGESAEATVLAIWDTGTTVNNDPIVGFRLEVRRASAPPYEAKTEALIGRLDVPRIQPGSVLPVRVDPKDPSRVALDIYEQRAR